MIYKLRMKANLWFNERVGAMPAAGSTETEKRPLESFRTPESDPKRKRGRGDKREIPHRIEEFYPRGSAGRREARGPRGPRKAAMPHRGNRTKYPK